MLLDNEMTGDLLNVCVRQCPDEMIRPPIPDALSLRTLAPQCI